LHYFLICGTMSRSLCWSGIFVVESTIFSNRDSIVNTKNAFFIELFILLSE
jgi:hypothetical protein